MNRTDSKSHPVTEVVGSPIANVIERRVQRLIGKHWETIASSRPETGRDPWLALRLVHSEARQIYGADRIRILELHSNRQRSIGGRF